MAKFGDWYFKEKDINMYPCMQRKVIQQIEEGQIETPILPMSEKHDKWIIIGCLVALAGILGGVLWILYGVTFHPFNPHATQ